jgi:hypothetical protein
MIPDDKHEFFPCRCHTFEHVIELYYSPGIECSMDNAKGIAKGKEPRYDDTVCVNKFLQPWPLVFYKRILNAIRYLFNIEREFGDFDTTILDGMDFDRLIELLKNIRNIDFSDHAVDTIRMGHYQSLDILSRSLDVDSCDNTVRFVASVFDDRPTFRNTKEVHVFVFLKWEKSIFKRLWRGIKYICGYRSRYGDSDSFEIKANEAKHLVKIIEEVKAHNEKAWDEMAKNHLDHGKLELDNEINKNA